MKVLDQISEDVARYTYLGSVGRIRTLLLVPGARVTALYRLERSARQRRAHAGIWFTPVHLLLKLVSRSNEFKFGISLPPEAVIGRGLYIGHFGGIIVGGDVRIGDNCCISQGVTIGRGGRGAKRGSPIIGDRVYIGPGAKVFGSVRIGDDVAIGANAVVSSSVPARAIVAGVPAKSVSNAGSYEFVRYAGMDQDPGRRESLRYLENL